MKDRLPLPSAAGLAGAAVCGRAWAMALCGLWLCLQPAVGVSGESLDAARPFVEEVWPAVVQRGETCRIELRGSGLQQAVGLWTSVPGITLKARPVTTGDGETVVLEVDVPREAPAGLFGLRLATASGLSNACVFLIDELSITRNETAQEQSAGRTEAIAVELPACVAGKCRPEAVDRYAITVEAGQRVAVEVVGSRFGRDYDPLVRIRDASGTEIASCDNSAGLFFDCRFAHVFAAAGTYTVEVGDARYQGDSRWNYVLRLGDFPVVSSVLPSLVPAGSPTGLHLATDETLPEMADGMPVASAPANIPAGWFFHELRLQSAQTAIWVPLERGTLPALFESEPNYSQDQCCSCSFPAAIYGVFDRPGDEDWFEIDLTKGDKIRIQGVSSDMGSAADLELVLYEPVKNGEPREVRRNDETLVRDAERNTSYVTEAGFTFAARFSGAHRLQVREISGGGGAGFTYRVDLERDTPRLTLTSHVGRLSLPVGSWQPLPLTVKREGFTGDIQLSLLDAPAGVTLEPAVIPDGEDEIVCRLKAEEGAAPAIAALQVLGRAEVTVEGESFSLRATAGTHPLLDRQLRNKDRIQLALRIDQRELPPSLRNRLALQVLPPAPFDVVLPAEHVLLAKYLTADFPIEIRRQPGFSSPVEFELAGGQIGKEAEERVQVYCRVPVAAGSENSVTARLFNRILTSPQTHRVDVTATARHNERWVTLTRTFTLEVRPAFQPQFEPATVELHPGETKMVRVTADRVAGFTGAVQLSQPIPQPGADVPEEIEIPAGQESVEFAVSVPESETPRRVTFRYESVGQVGEYQELLRSPLLTLDIRKPPKPAAK